MGYTEYGIEIKNRIEELSTKEVQDVLFDAIDYQKVNGNDEGHYVLYVGETEVVNVKAVQITPDSEMVIMAINPKGDYFQDNWRAPMNPYNTKNHLKRVLRTLVANCR